MQLDTINITLISNNETTTLVSNSFEYDFYDKTLSLHAAGSNTPEEGSRLEQFMTLQNRKDIVMKLNGMDIIEGLPLRVDSFRSNWTRKYREGVDTPEWEWRWHISLVPVEPEKDGCPCDK